MATIEATLRDGSLAGIGQLLRNRHVSAEETVRWFLARAEGAGRALNAIRTLAPDALAEARARDAELAAGQDRGPLHGIPVLLKDNIFVAGLLAAAGAAALAAFRPATDATLVTRLRAAGAIILGKTNLTELADYVSDVMPSSFSGAGGHVVNPHGALPYGRGQGSSVGSAAAVAAGLAPLAIGSETQNSIQAPASVSSVVGYKPSVGLVSRAGVVPLVPSQDSPGPLARSVADAALALAALAGPDAADTATLDGAWLPGAPLLLEQLTGLRIGVPRHGLLDAAEQAPLLGRLEDVLTRLAAAGATILDPCDLPSALPLRDVRSCVFRTEFKAAFDALMATLGAPCGIGGMADLVRWNEANPGAIPFGQPLLLAALATGGLADPAYRQDRARDIALSRTAGIDAALEGAGADLLLAPMGTAAKATGKAGAPAIAIPCGALPDGSPFGVTLFGRRGSDRLLLAAARLVERAVGERLSPTAAF